MARTASIRTITALVALTALAGVATPAQAQAAKPKCKARAATVPGERTSEISVRCKRFAGRRISVRKAPRHGLLGHLDQRHDTVDYRPDAGYRGADRLVVERRRNGRRYRTPVSIQIGDEDAVNAPACQRVAVQANYETPIQISIRCQGAGIADLTVDAGPFSGALSNVSVATADGASTLTATYRPEDLYVGQEAIIVSARDADGAAFGAILIDVRPWRMRAIGDSVTAGFGYFGNGELMPLDDLLDCKPPEVVNNRCSSNSDAGPSYTGVPSWSQDFGLANNVSWAAQFANTWQGGGHITAPGMFQNRAVTGSAPSDWLEGGLLHSELESIIASDPDLIAMTMGANPLLSTILLTTAGEECSLETTVATLQQCVQAFFDQVNLTTRLQELFTEVLAAPDAEVMVFQYNLSIPSANLFDVWQLEVLIDYFNQQIATAVNATKAAVPAAQSARLHLIEAQRDPTSPSPSKVPRFDIGLPPDPPFQTWTAPFDCGDGDMVDGHSHQSDPTQIELHGEHPLEFCTGTPWVIEADSGIHPSRDGYAQFAATLANVATAENLIPTLP